MSRGVVLEDFQAYVESKGLFYPPDPGERKPLSAVISAHQCRRYACCEIRCNKRLCHGGWNWFWQMAPLSRQAVRIEKDTYPACDLKEIVIGSEGTLAVITKCILKLIPKPEDSLFSVLLSFDSLKAGIESVRTKLFRPI